MGFGAAAAAKPSPTMLCLVRLPAGDAKKATEAEKKGADAVILEGEPGKVKETGALLVGVRSDKGGRSPAADFVVLEPQSAAEVLLEEEIGLVLTLGEDASDMTLRMMGDLRLDALIVPTPESPLSIAHLMELRRIASLSRTPLLTEVAAEATGSHLRSLREAGVAGVIIDGKVLAKLSGLRETIESLPPRRRRRGGLGEATLPSRALVPGEDEHEEDEDEDYGDDD
jgi:hypothetical protein